MIDNRRNDKYPGGTSARLLGTHLVKPLTTSVLEDRIKQKRISAPVFFNDVEFKLLGLVASLLIPQTFNGEYIDLAGMFDQRLLSGKGKGWRYNTLPPDEILFKAGLQGIEETVSLMYDERFIFLSYEKQHTVLSAIQSGTAEGEIWKKIPSALYFTELLASLTELYYSHPIAKDEIGEVSYADAAGWKDIGLNEHEQFEPLPLTPVGNA